MKKKLRLGMIGGGQGAFIGAVHRIASRIDDRYELVAGCLSSTAEKALISAKEIGIANATIFPKNCSLVWMLKELPRINKTPDIPNKIEIKVIKLIFSFKKIYPKNAKKIVSVVIIKSTLATVV